MIKLFVSSNRDDLVIVLLSILSWRIVSGDVTSLPSYLNPDFSELLYILAGLYFKLNFPILVTNCETLMILALLA